MGGCWYPVGLSGIISRLLRFEEPSSREGGRELPVEDRLLRKQISSSDVVVVVVAVVVVDVGVDVGIVVCVGVVVDNEVVVSDVELSMSGWGWFEVEVLD